MRTPIEWIPFKAWSTTLTTSMIQQNSWSRKSLKNVRTEHSELVRRRFTRLMRGNTRDASVGYVPGCSWKGSNKTC